VSALAIVPRPQLCRPESRLLQYCAAGRCFR
jgi:hypothetical protein